MAGLFKKALSVFVEFDEESGNPSNSGTSQTTKNTSTTAGSQSTESPKITLNKDEIEKFEKHFDSLMDQANLPGPDYFEFCKMMEALEAAVPDEKARYAAVFASLKVQGLTKDNLISTAGKYKAVIQDDKAKFDIAVNDKLKGEVESRKVQLKDLGAKIVQNTETIKKLTQEITDAQNKIQLLNAEVGEKENKIKSNSEGYTVACNAMLNKINIDIQKIQSLI
jgi:predicted  nucleic acid-binding Zn-ribbon protein